MNKLKEKSFLFWSIKEYALDICDILNITCPIIKVVSNKETLATYYPSGNLIELSDTYTDDYDYAFAIAHELRNVWQLKYKHADFASNGYIMYHERENDDEYYLQPLELDANSFSFAINYVYLDIVPSGNAYSKKVMDVFKQKVNIMIKEISNERCPKFEYKKTVLN